MKLRWFDNFIIRPHVIRNHGDAWFLSRENPWHVKWVDTPNEVMPRDAWPWRIRIEICTFNHLFTLGLLFWDKHRWVEDTKGEPGFGIFFYIARKGWIESVAT
jgi:hypothetical protein